MTAQYQTANYSTPANLTIAMENIASSATEAAGVYGTFVDNRTTGYTVIHCYAKWTGGTNALAGTTRFYPLRSDGTTYPDSITQATGGAWTMNTGQKPTSPIARVGVMPTNTTGGAFTLSFKIHDPGPYWSVGNMHDTGVNSQVTAGNFLISWVGERGESQ